MHSARELNTSVADTPLHASALIRAISPQIPTGLIAPDNLAIIERVASIWPATMVPHMALESRLGTTVAAADLTLVTTIASGGRAVLAGGHPHLLPPKMLDAQPSWRGLRAFVSQWADPHANFHASVDNLYLEYDTASGDPGDQVPNVFVGIRPETMDHVVLECAQLLTTAEPGSPVIGCLRKVLAALPSCATLTHLGAMMARRPAPMRVLLSGLAPDDLAGYLTAIGWRGPIQELTARVIRWQSYADKMLVTVDILEEVGPRIGVEFYQLSRPGGSGRELWRPFLEQVMHAGLAVPQKVEAVLEYMGVSTATAHPDSWPEGLRQAALLLGGQNVPVLSRYLNHVKIVFEDGQAVEAKAYPALSLNWVHRAL